MKKYLLLIFAFCIFGQLSAQEGYNIGYSSSNPVGQFKSTSIDDDGNFAERGWSIMLENKSTFRSWPENLFLGFHFSYQQNDLNTVAVADAFTAAIDGATAEVSGGNYNPFVITLGPFYDIHLSHRFSLGLKTGIGIMVTNIDPMRISLEDGGGNLLLTEILQTEGVPAFTYLLGASLNFYLTESFGLGLYADYSSANEKVNATFEELPEFSSEVSLSFINAGVSVYFLVN